MSTFTESIVEQAALGLGVRLSDRAGSEPEQRDLFAATVPVAGPSATNPGG